ncbi:MAG: hypothetical protein HRU29_01110 [Rhizobiales bacterium]|nr:hypothetical protein [Hyphomicrobiales bacterium]NRB12971.1 hypothetical protein [Hyphomicrobiales bacterium]
MRRLISNLFGLVIFIAIAAGGGGVYIDSKANDSVYQAIETLKEKGYELSEIGEFSINYLNQTVTLKNLVIASENPDQFKLSIDEITLSGIDPVSNFQISVKNSQFRAINLTYNGKNHKFDNVDIAGLKFDYQPHFTDFINAENLNKKIQKFHNEIRYDQVTFSGYTLSDNTDNVTKITDGAYQNDELVNNLPSVWNLQLTGMQISRSHLSKSYISLLNSYRIKELNGILDIDFEYKTQNRNATLNINNLNFGGLGNLQAELIVAMTEDRLSDFYDISQIDENLNKLPIEYAKLIYHDLGLYNYFIGQQARKFNLNEMLFKSQIRFALTLSSNLITNIDKRRALLTPVTKFVAKPAGLKIEIAPEKPVRFEHYLNVYDANILVRDLNPSIEYLE